jgi:hypothetical protein
VQSIAVDSWRKCTVCRLNITAQKTVFYLLHYPKATSVDCCFGVKGVLALSQMLSLKKMLSKVLKGLVADFPALVAHISLFGSTNR